MLTGPGEIDITKEKVIIAINKDIYFLNGIHQILMHFAERLSPAARARNATTGRAEFTKQAAVPAYVLVNCP